MLLGLTPDESQVMKEALERMVRSTSGSLSREKPPTKATKEKLKIAMKLLDDLAKREVSSESS